MKKILLLLMLVPLLTTVWAQNENSATEKKSTPSPDFPGALVFEYGLNYLINPTFEMRTNAWKSATFNVYYMYPTQIGKSRFSVSPGVGVGSEKFGFLDPVTLQDSLGFTLLRNVADLPRFTNLTEVRQSQFIANYADFVLEFRVHTLKDDHKRSWFLSVGGKIGVNFYAKTKVKYSEFGSKKIYKDKYHFNVNSFRYGMIARIGYGPFNVWYYLTGSNLFRGNKALNFNNPTMWSFGVSLATF